MDRIFRIIDEARPQNTSNTARVWSFEKIRDSSAVIVGVVNHEYSPVNYTIDLRINNSTLLRKL